MKIKALLIKYAGANYRTTLTGIGTALTAALTTLAAIPYQIEDVGMIIPATWKATLVKVGLASTVILKIMNSIYSKSNNVSGNASEGFKVATSQGEQLAVIPATTPPAEVRVEALPAAPKH